MNILLPDSWLREYLETNLTPEEIAREVSLCGPSFERIYQKEGEVVYDIEVTTNRVDSANVRGIARETAAILKSSGFQATFLPNGKQKSLTLDQFKVSTLLPLPIITNEASNLTKKILCVVLDQVKNTPTPPLIAKRLLQVDENIHTSLVDITNYVTHEIGHPCHAFDYDKVMALGGEIIIKQASKGQKFTTLSHETYTTLGGEVIFTTKSGEIIDLPAIKGMENTAIDNQTTRILFWLENLDAQVVRHASMSHAIRTLAAQLNEKNVDPALAELTMSRGIQLFQEFCEAKIASNFFEWKDKKLKEKPLEIKLSLSRLNTYLGMAISPEKVGQILESLEFQVEKEDDNFVVKVPSFRQYDVKIEADVIEEVARLYGYHLLPSRLNFPLVQIPKQKGVYFDLESKFRHFLAAQGLSEVYTYSAIAEDQITKPINHYLKIANPLSEDHVYLRQSLVASLLEVYANNQGKTDKIKGIFELAKVYYPGKDVSNVSEPMKLTLIMTMPYREAKAVIEQMLSLVYLTWSQDFGQVEILTDDKIAYELDIAEIGKKTKKYPKLEPLSQYPILTEDLTFIVKNKEIGILIEQMKAASPLLQAINLKDIYQQNFTFNYIYRSQEKALKNEEIAPIREQIVKIMTKNGCELVGKLI